MHIEEIIIDGFKSYATRTVVSGFDPRFNAITGLNGSGKSNILDSICFVLGISNLSQVRANNLQELVYKQGQAGVTKASVTIVFNNCDTKSSPVGYEQYDQITVTRQVVIGGRNKYLINGHTAQQSQVQNLFHSVQLNVNNPHFLIMQGRITKVLNMKPPEILGMIEEAAGTRMYENKKQSALRTIEKKQSKVDEINKVLTEEITPTLEKLRLEKTHYLKWASNNTECERLERFCLAHEYVQAETNLRKSSQHMSDLNHNVQTMTQKAQDLDRELQAKKTAIADLTTKKEQEMEGAFRLLQEREESLSKELVHINTVWQNKNDSLQKETTSQKAIVSQLTEQKNEILLLEKDLAKMRTSADEASSFADKTAQNLDSLQRRLQALSAGVSAGEEGEKSLANLIAEKTREVQMHSTTIQQENMKISHSKQLIKEKRAQMEDAKTERGTIDADLASTTTSIAQLEGELSVLNYDEAAEKNLWTQKSIVEEKLSRCKGVVNTLKAQLSARLSFEYSNPYPNFDRSKVKGLVADLFSVKDSQWATALEMAAGAKLYQVVVDTEETGKQLLKNGKLRARVTIIPLNKISHRMIPTEKVRKAEEIAGSKSLVRAAISLIGCADDVKNAMEYVFGQALLCENMDVAKQVTFHKDIKVRSITKDGDAFDPAGTLQGGSRPSASSVLLKLQEMSLASEEVGRLQAELASVTDRLKEISNLEEKYNAVQQQLELKRHWLDLLKQRLQKSEYTQLEKDSEHLQAAIKASEQLSTQTQNALVVTKRELSTLEQQLGKMNESREQQEAQLGKQIAKAKHEYANLAKKAKELQRVCDGKALEIEQLQNEERALTHQLETADLQCQNLAAEVDSLGEQVAAKKAQYEDARRNLLAKKKDLSKCDGDLKNLVKEEETLVAEKSAVQIEIKKMEHKITQFHKDQASTEKLVEAMTTKHPWIVAERQFFGKPHTDYDFGARNPAEAERLLKRLKEEQSTLSKKINKKVMGMIEKAEQEYQNLMKKRVIIEKDKEKIHSVIDELDNKKNEALKTTWEKVNKDFGSIFSTLLPGTQAKLDPTESGSILDGLEVRVAFGNVWKESLTELSGGQRSLLALSLILSLLLFKPAPMYILDEVDAALDLSHTQNIGQMIKNHFSHSQFIVVSLKEGMFNNANVVFRTKFVDGVSTVSKSVSKIHDSSNGHSNESENVVPNQKDSTSGRQLKKKRTRVT